MADPLTVLGGVAASVQLIDVAAKLSKELYSFFRSVRGANADTRRQLEILNDLQAAFGLVVSFISSSSKARSRDPIDNGYTKLETVLQKLCDELRSIQVLIPPGPHISFAAKMRWTVKRKEFEARLKEIEYRKTSLLTILELLAMQEQKLLIGKTDDIEAAMQDLNMHISHTRVANTAILDSVSTLNTNTTAHRTGMEQALHDMAHVIPCDGDKTRMAIEAHGEQLHRFGDMLSHHSTYMGGWMSAQTQLLQDLAIALPQETSRIGDRLNDLMRLASVTSPCSRQTISEYKVVPKTEHLIARIARDEIRRATAPVLEALAQSQVRNEKLAKSLNDVLEDVSSRLWDDNRLDERLDRQSATSQQPHARATRYTIPQIRDNRNHTDPEYSHAHTREQMSEVSDSNFSSDECEIKKELERLNCQTHRKPFVSSDGKCAKYQKLWTYWSSISWLGNIRIEIRRRKTWGRYQATCSGDVSILVTFWPLWPLLRRRGLSLLYTTEPCHNGYCQIMPAIATFQIIPRGATIVDIIRKGDNDGVRREIENGRVSVNAQDDLGLTLLHWACLARQLETCKMLLTMGADPVLANARYSALYCLLDVAWATMAWQGKDIFQFSCQQLIQLIRDFAQAGGDNWDWLWHPHNIKLYRFGDEDQLPLRPSVTESAVLAEFSAFLRGNDPCLSDNLDDGLVRLLPEISMHIATALEFGLNPNYGKNERESPIFILLRRASCFPADEQVNFHAENLSILLNAGADKYKTFWVPAEVRHLFPRSLLLTPTVWAIYRDVVHVWETALRLVGLDPAEVYAEDERRRREFLRLSGGTTSSLNYGNSDTMSMLRLRERRAFEED